MGAKCRCECLRDRPHAATRETPRPYAAINIAHGMVEQNISCARRIYTQPRTDDAAARIVCEDNVTLKILFQILGDGHCEKTDELIKLAF